MSPAIRVLLVDDHPIVQQGLAAIINEELDMTVVGRAKDSIEAIELFRQAQPDVVLMDLRMPKLAQRMNNPELTDRELEVLRLVAQGMSNLEISAALNITKSTVKSNINRILSKLRAKDRTQATIIALKQEISNL